MKIEIYNTSKPMSMIHNLQIITDTTEAITLSRIYTWKHIICRKIRDFQYLKANSKKTEVIKDAIPVRVDLPYLFK